MKYLCLVYIDETQFYALPPEEIERLYSNGENLALEFQESPTYIDANGLQPTTTAATVRVRGGHVTVTDGPFAETKEQLGGYLLLDVDNLDEAIRMASRIPSACHGSVEIRPVRELK